MKKEINRVVKERRAEMEREAEGSSRAINFSAAHELRILAEKCDSVVGMLDKFPESADVPVLHEELKEAVARIYERLFR